MKDGNHSKDLPKRKPLRIDGFDYSTSGAYFVTICTHGGRGIFGEIDSERVVLSACGEIARECWDAIPRHFPEVCLDVSVVMPNHVHGIVWLDAHMDEAQARESGMRAREHGMRARHASPLQAQPERMGRARLGDVVGSFKSAVSRRVNRVQETAGRNIWQRNYYEHVIRHEVELEKIREYVANNPARWTFDIENPNSRRSETHDVLPWGSCADMELQRGRDVCG